MFQRVCSFVLSFLTFFHFNFVHSEDVHLPFSHIGTVHQTDRLLVVHAYLDLNPIWSNCKSVLDNLNEARKQKHAQTWLLPAVTHLQGQCDFSHSLIDTSFHTRPKRQLGLIAVAATSILGTLGLESLFHSDDKQDLEAHHHEIIALSEEIDSLAKSTKSLAMDFNALTNELQAIQYSEAVSKRVQFVSNRISDISSGLVALLHGSLSHQLFHPDTILDIWSNVTAFTARHRLHLAFDNFLNLYEVPVTFSLRAGLIEVRLPIPMVSKSLLLYELLPFPFLLHDMKDFSPFIALPRDTLIAVDHARANHFPLSSSDLSRCIKLGTRFYCSHLISFKTSSCIERLFFGYLEDISSYCQMVHFPDKLALQLISTTQLLISSHNKSITFTTDCSNGTLFRQTLKPGHQLIPLARSCAISSDYFSIPAFSVSSIRTTIRSSSISMNTSFLPLVPSDLPQIIHDVDVLGRHSRDLHSYIRLHPVHPTTPSIFDFSLFSLGIFCFLLFCVYLIFLYCKARKATAKHST